MTLSLETRETCVFSAMVRLRIHLCKFASQIKNLYKFPYSLLSSLLPAATKLWQGNVFTGVCDSVHTGECLVPGEMPGAGGLLPGEEGSALGGIWSRWVPGLGGVPGPGGVCSWGGLVPVGCLVETPPDGYCCGRYASYWSATQNTFGKNTVIFNHSF